ncbi:uncharacterized protein DFL_000349 [Arthrobotrys flagrans]|uniref:Uncharacterized protein n=1 Tax=Arthrobotrys flagrans TaxID=97331 RepID=A0A437ADW2_ARTFL|nr:hypothetical protein DFL_000349 [Arthrobotrys flagrans]
MSQSRKRARPCPKLDDDEIKEEMRVLYQVLSWKPQEIAEEINKNHNLTVTKCQGKPRQYIDEWPSGSRSRSIKRNLTALKEYRILRGIEDYSSTTELPGHIQICTPRAFDMDLVLPRPKVIRHIQLRILQNLPIWQFGCLLDKITLSPSHINNDGNLKITAHHSIPYSPLLRLIIYRISNNLISLLSGEIPQLLDRINELGLREPFKRLLSNTCLSISAVCELILPWLYVGQDLELVEFICEAQKIKLPLFDILLTFLPWKRKILNVGVAWVKTALNDIEKSNSLPRSPDELGALLRACKSIRGDISLFQRLWGQRNFPEFVTWGGRSLSKSTPLLTDDESQLELLLSLGFTGFKRELTLRAVLLDNHNITRVFLEHSGLISDGKSNLSRPENTTSQKRAHVWETLEIPVFYQIVSQFVTIYSVPNRTDIWHRELTPSESERERKYSINQTLVWAACLNPEMTEYIVQVMKWANPSLTESEVVTLALEMLPLWREHQEKHKFFRVDLELRLSKRFRPVLALKRLLRFDVDPTRTELWKDLIWNYLDVDWIEKCIYIGDDPWRKDHPEEYENTLEYLRVFLQCPNTINSDSCGLPTRRLRIEYSKVYGSKSRPPFKPIVVALFLKKPEAFLLLLESGASTTDFLPKGNYQAKFIINAEFIRACHNRDLQHVHDLWDRRIEAADVTDLSESDRVDRFLQNEDFGAATDFSLQSRNPLLRIKVFMAVAKAGTEPKHRSISLNLLRLLLDAVILPSLEDIRSLEFWHCQLQAYAYDDALHSAIVGDNIELVDTLLEYEGRSNLRKYGNPPQNWPRSRYEAMRSLRLSSYRARRNHVSKAASCSLRILKRLIDHGFDINEGPCEVSPSKGHTAFHGALTSGDMDTIVFVLQSGADIYAPCDRYSSAIEYTVCNGRIDATALILAVDPNCHHLALQAAEKTEHNYVAEYVRNWKPGSSSILSDQGSSAENISNRLPVALPV